MTSLSPWFQTAHLLIGIRKTVSAIEATRSGDDERRSAFSDHSAQRSTERKRARA